MRARPVTLSGEVDGMGTIDTVGWVLLAVAATFWIVWRRAATEIDRVRERERAGAAWWQAEAERERIRADRLKVQIDAYKTGHAEGVRMAREMVAVARGTGRPGTDRAGGR